MSAKAPLVKIPHSRVPGMVGKLVHLSWAHPGARFTLVRIENGTAVCKTNRSDREIRTHVSSLLYLRGQHPRREAA